MAVSPLWASCESSVSVSADNKTNEPAPDGRDRGSRSSRRSCVFTCRRPRPTQTRGAPTGTGGQGRQAARLQLA